ncbi:DUF5926 family protein [Actinokineospora inagensis]|uniref:DUF5926 family protein n=1 Tax=Actinokineospora inagensis TaxID=103730 RepID=UPI000407BC49|nr:DUF5926 family protein [Actinokineospora inagensis]
MSRRSAVKNKAKAPDASGIGPRQPCPCGSGKRYKACHGSAGGAVEVAVARPFEGLAAECELVALREFVPSGTAALPLVEADREITLATVLPMAAAALVRADGVAYVGLQVQTRSSDISRDLARAVRWALTAKAGDVLAVVGPDTDPGDQPERLQDLVPTDAPLEAAVHGDFSWWMPEGSEPTGEVALSLERANSAILPTERIGAAAYWVDAGERAHLRWVRPEPEEDLLAALARLHAKGELGLGEGSRYAGSFRAHGLLVPVWDLDREPHAREWTEAVDQLGTRLDAALASLAGEPLTSDERRARDGLVGRQITIR